MRAPPHVLYPVIASIRLPKPAALVELPGGEAVYAEVERGRVVANVLRTDVSSVTFQPFAGVLHSPSEPPEVDWEAVEAETWSADKAADATWAAWAEENVAVAPFRGVTPPTADEKGRILRAYVLPSLVALAMTTSPNVDTEPTLWVSLRSADEG